MVMSWSVRRLLPIFTSLLALGTIRPLAILGQSRITDPKVRVIWMCTNPGGRVTIDNYTLRMLVKEVYGVQEFQIEGGQFLPAPRN
jgi:hypothetical protein